MSLAKPIATYEDVPGDYVRESMMKSCFESQYIASRSTSIVGNTARWLTNKWHNKDIMEHFNDKYLDMNSCQCEGHYMMRIHSVVALFSFLGVFNIDPETNI